MRALEVLTVRLEREGDVLRRSYFAPGLGHLERYDSVGSWSGFDEELRFGEHVGLEGLACLLDQGGEESLETHLMRKDLAKVGEVLFRVLFGDPEDWIPLLRAAHQLDAGAADPTPVYRGLRLRILSEDALLANLPWRLSAWKGRWLMDLVPPPGMPWTFESVVEEPMGRVVELPGPCKILVVAPRWQQARTEEHLEALRTVLKDVSKHYEDENHLLVVEDRQGVEKALRAMQPQILYYYGHGDTAAGQPALLLGRKGESADPLPLADLRGMLATPPPDLVFLNACQLGSGGWQGAGRQLVPPMPFVCANATSAFARYATQLATNFFQRLLKEGRDPVAALHHLPRQVSTADFQWATAGAWTAYRQWVTRLETGQRLHRRPGDRLDRDYQRALARKHVDELRRSPNRRVEVFVSCGFEGSLIDRLGEQLYDYLRHQEIRITWRRRDPEDPNPLVFEPGRLQEELEIWLGNQEMGLTHALGAEVPSRGKIHVLGLDWGVFGPRHRQQPSVDEIAEWICFCTDVLAPNCPDDLRIVCHLAMEISLGEEQTLEDEIEELADQHLSDAFRCTFLPILEDVKLRDIRNYLADRANTNCPAPLAREMARLIFAKAKGNYQETVKLIDEGEKGWNQFYRKLKKEAETHE
jgi:hypothetical protein